MEKRIPDGVALAHETLGQADAPILLVHGWTCDHTYFAPQAEHFSRNHRVISVDLRGHGESDKPEQDYSMAGYADDIAWLCGQLAAAKPVIIGHSMGGVIAFEVAARHPGLPGAVVAVDSPICPPDAVREAIQPVIDGVKVPALLLNAEGPGWPLAGVQRIKELCPQVMVGQTVGAGHFHQLLVPDQVNPMIDRFLTISVSGDA